MALDFTYINQKTIVFSIPDSDIGYFESACFDDFNKKYNDLIDVYGTFRLEINHLEYLKTLLEKDKNKAAIAQEFLSLLNHCIDNNNVVKVYGD